MCGLSVEALKRDGVNNRSNASMDKSFDGMHEKYDFDSIRCSVNKKISISISMIVTSVFLLVIYTGNKFDVSNTVFETLTRKAGK